MTWLLEHHPIYIWSFFFGLIVASSVLVAKEIKHWHIGTVISLIAGGCIAYVITVMSPAETPNTWWFIILSGAIVRLKGCKDENIVISKEKATLFKKWLEK